MTSENKNLDEYTRANVGVLCGNLESIVGPLNNSWTDLLWAYLKVQIDIRVESEIRSCSVRSYIEMPDKYWQGKMSMEQIFDELNAHKNVNVRTTANNPVNIIQKYLILDDIPEMMRNIDLWITESSVDAHMLRFLTHVVLFMRQIGRQHQEDIADKVIKTYVECLIGLGEARLIAFYTAALPQPIQIVLYATYLETLDETASRQEAIDEAINVGLDVQAITTYTVNTVRNQHAQPDEPRLQQGTISAFDLRKISVLEWLTFCADQTGELLWQANAMIRSFIAENKIECVRKSFKMVPRDAIQQIIQFYGTKENLPIKEEFSIKEYLCHQTYLGSVDGYNDWTRLYHSKPKEPLTVDASANFTERIAAEHREHAYKTELERWTINLEEQTRGKANLVNKLRFQLTFFLFVQLLEI